MYGLLVDQLRHNVKLESILAQFFRHRYENKLGLEVDWLEFGHLLSEFAISQFGTADVGMKKIASKCKKGVPREDRVAMTEDDYSVNRNLNRRVYAATKKIIKSVVAFWRLLGDNDGSAPILLNRLSKQNKGFWLELTGGCESDGNMFVAAIKSTSEETMAKLTKVLSISKYGYSKLPKNMEAGMEAVAKKEMLTAQASSSNSSSGQETADRNKEGTYTGRFSNIDDDDMLVNEYDNNKNKKPKANLSEESVCKDLSPLKENDGDSPAGSGGGSDGADYGDVGEFADEFSLDEEEHGLDEEEEHEEAEKQQIQLTPDKEALQQEQLNPSEESKRSTATDSSISTRAAKDFFMSLTEVTRHGILDLQWGVDLFLDAVTLGEDSVISLTDLAMLKTVLSDSERVVWNDAVYNAKRLCEKVDIEYENASQSTRFRLMQLFANTSIENSVMKKIVLPLLVKFQGSAVLDTTFSYGNNREFRFVLLRYNVSHSCIDGMIEARQFCTSFSFFHTQRFQEKLSKIIDKRNSSSSSSSSSARYPRRDEDYEEDD